MKREDGKFYPESSYEALKVYGWPRICSAMEPSLKYDVEEYFAELENPNADMSNLSFLRHYCSLHEEEFNKSFVDLLNTVYGGMRE